MAESSIVVGVSSSLGNATNAAMSIERALQKLHASMTTPEYGGIVARLPDIIKTTLLPALGAVLSRVKEVVEQFLKGDALAQFKAVLEAGLAVVGSTMDLLTDAAQKAADTARRFLAVVVDFTSAGLEHIKAIADLLGKIGAVLAGKSGAETQLTDQTLKALALVA